MVDSENEAQEVVESVVVSTTNDVETNQVVSTNEAKNDASSLERSYEVVSPIVRKTSNMSANSNEKTSEHVEQNQQETENDNGHNKTRSNSESKRRNSFQERIRKSGSFLSKLNSANQNNTENESSNLSSSIAGALSSFSSFTSNFALGSSSNGNASSLTIETASTTTKLSQITETREDIFNKIAALERKNLIKLTKLIVRDLISSSLSAGRTIDDCHNAIHLNNYFTLIDKVLKHGLKQNLLSNKSASLWTALDNLPKYLKESTLMSESVRSLAHTKTPDGKIKAWMRLAMMQKKLPEYFSELLANKNVLLKDIYHDYAFMLNDEALVFAGLIIGVNVIDCNFFAKDANFDLMDDIIDLSPYLRAANSYDDDQESSGYGDQMKLDEQPRALDNLTKVLDQKNYLEERNRWLESTIASLHSKIKSLEEQNSKLEMEAKVSEVRIQKLQGKRGDTPTGHKQSSSLPITDAIKNFIAGTESATKTNDSMVHPSVKGSLHIDGANAQEVSKTSDQIEGNQADSSQATEDQEQKETSIKGEGIEEEVSKLPQTLSNELPPKSSVNHSKANSKVDENQQHVIDDLKKQISERDKELVSLKERVGILETSYRGALEKIKILERDLDVQTSMNADKEVTIKIYEKDIRDKQNQVETLRNSLNDAKKLNSDLSERFNDTSAKLKDRIKSVSNLQASLDKWKLENKTLASRLQDKQNALLSVSNDLENSQKMIEELKKYNVKINEDLKRERECGHSSSVTVETQNNKIAELSEKLEAFENELKDVRPFREQTDDLKRRCQEYEQSLEEIGAQLRESRLEVENLKENSAVFLDSQWMDSKQVKTCALCQQSFSVTRRKHHCRLCGNVFCQTCSDNKMELASSAKPVRVCDTCHAFLLAKFVKSSSSS